MSSKDVQQNNEGEVVTTLVIGHSFVARYKNEVLNMARTEATSIEELTYLFRKFWWFDITPENF